MIKILNTRNVNKNEIFERSENLANVSASVSEIISKVREEGDKALYELTEKFDGVSLEDLAVSEEETAEALSKVEPEFLEVLKKSAANIKAFHEKQKRDGFEIKMIEGSVLGQKITPIGRAGLYVPGGTAAYPSTVLMDSIPAKVAGCPEIIMTTPPSKDGKVLPQILAAASVAGVDRIFKIGGAQAIAAMAYGTETVPKVDKIVGPGNAFVAEAKRQVFGAVAVDMIAGPSEILIIADKNSNPGWVAADLLSQAEHDVMASAVLITNSEELAAKVSEEIEARLPALEREQIARKSVDSNGKIIICDSLDKAIEISNEIAPEHLELCVDEPFKYLAKVQNAGSVFLGRYCPEALGDYFAGPNHTLPTGGTAKFSSPLSVDDFIKKTQYTYYTKSAMQKAAADIALFANKEGLTAHAKSALSRLEDNK